MSKYNNITGDKISSALKGDQKAFTKGWDRVFNKEDLDVKVTVDWGVDTQTYEDVLDEMVEINQETGQYDVELGITHNDPVEAGEVVAKIVKEYTNE